MSTPEDTYQFDADTVKIVIAIGCTLFAMATVAAIPLSLILYVGLGYGLFRRDAVYVKLSTRLVQYVPLFGSAAWLILASYQNQIGELESDYVLGAIAVFGVVIVAVIALEILWLNPLRRRLHYLSSLGSSAAVGLREFFGRPRAPKIMHPKFPSSFSAAEELEKWHALKNTGAISEEEFAAAKQRLMS